VACHWRIRHKLMLGLGLVVGLMALVLAATLHGLQSYSRTIKSIGSKLAELNEAEEFKTAVYELDRPPDLKGQDIDPFAWLKKAVHNAEERLREYEDQLRDTLTRRRDHDNGFMERELIGALRGGFTKLLALAAAKANEPQMAPNSTWTLLQDAQVKAAIHKLMATADQLRNTMYEDQNRRIEEARSSYRSSMAIVISTCISGMLLLAWLTRFFYGWVFYPIRDLDQGVGRIAQGDFEHRIEVHSGDEMEDLAAAFNDMTGRLREMYRDLSHQVNERSRQLVRSERLASVGFLAAGVAHEINNPLASIAFCSEALEGRLAGKLACAANEGEVISKYLRMIQQEAFRCKAITQRLLEFSRGGERRREPTDLAELIQGVLDMVQHLQNCKGKQIVFEPRGRLVAWVNGQEIKSVVLNLVVNALDSMDDGGTLTILLASRDRMAEILFADTGCGMSAEVLENIFEPFFTRSRTGKGTGLGLSISHRIISQHRGEIEASSSGPNQGSTFRVRLPLQPAESSDQQSAISNQPSAISSPRSETKAAA
jgi:signal transduction histidine kinase